MYLYIGGISYWAMLRQDMHMQWTIQGGLPPSAVALLWCPYKWHVLAWCWHAHGNSPIGNTPSIHIYIFIYIYICIWLGGCVGGLFRSPAIYIYICIYIIYICTCMCCLFKCQSQFSQELYN